MIEADRIGYRIPNGQWLWRDLSIKLKRGCIVGVIGRNGSGKTTLLRALLTLIKPHEGCVIIKGTVGYVPQRTEITFPFSVRDIVAMGRVRHVRLFASLSRIDRQIIDWAMECTGVSIFADRSFHSLSGGERQMVLISRAVAAECDTLILDEPFTGLDLDNQRHTLSLLKKLASLDGLGILFTAHHPDHLFAAAQEALILRRDEITIMGSTTSYLTPELLSQLYGVDVHVIDVPRGERVSRHAVAYLET